MNELIGSWLADIACVENDGFSIPQCVITFDNKKCVIEDTFINGQVARNWYYYRYEVDPSRILLFPINAPLKLFYKDHPKEILLTLIDSVTLVIKHSDSIESTFRKQLFFCNHENGDKLPIKPKIYTSSNAQEMINNKICELYDFRRMS